MNEVKVIEQEYDGIKFRSRTEAKWAMFFNLMGWKYTYEIEGYESMNGIKYCPDFILHLPYNEKSRVIGDIFVEVKGKATDYDIKKWLSFAKEHVDWHEKYLKPLEKEMHQEYHDCYSKIIKKYDLPHQSNEYRLLIVGDIPKVYEYNDEFFGEGKEAYIEDFYNFFKEEPNLHCLFWNFLTIDGDNYRAYFTDNGIQGINYFNETEGDTKKVCQAFKEVRAYRWFEYGSEFKQNKIPILNMITKRQRIQRNLCYYIIKSKSAYSYVTSSNNPGFLDTVYICLGNYIQEVYEEKSTCNFALLLEKIKQYKDSDAMKELVNMNNDRQLPKEFDLEFVQECLNEIYKLGEEK